MANPKSPNKTLKSTAAVAAVAERREPVGPNRNASLRKKVVVLGTVKADGGHYQVLAPAAPTKHVSAADLDLAVRRVVAAR